MHAQQQLRSKHIPFSSEPDVLGEDNSGAGIPPTCGAAAYRFELHLNHLGASACNMPCMPLTKYCVSCLRGPPQACLRGRAYLFHEKEATLLLVNMGCGLCTQPPPQRSPCWSWTCAPVHVTVMQHVQCPGSRDRGQVHLWKFPLLNSYLLAKYFIFRVRSKVWYLV